VFRWPSDEILPGDASRISVETPPIGVKNYRTEVGVMTLLMFVNLSYFLKILVHILYDRARFSNMCSNHEVSTVQSEKLSEMLVWDIFIYLAGLKSFWNTPKSRFFVSLNSIFQSFPTFQPKTDNTRELCVAWCPIDKDSKFSLICCFVMGQNIKPLYR